MVKEVAAKKDQLPAVAGFEEEEGGGFEDADAASFAIPFLMILQSGSPQVKKSDGAYIDGAMEGMLLDTVSQQAIDGEEGITAIPCHYRRAYVEWVDRDKGGGFVKEHTVAEGEKILPTCQRDDKNNDVMPNGNHLVDTRYHYILLMKADGIPKPIVVTMTSTAIKKSRRWMSMSDEIKFPRQSGVGVFTPPLFSHMYTLRTVPETKDQYSWFNWEPTLLRVLDLEDGVDKALFDAAKTFRDQIKSGEVREATETLQQEASAEKEEF